MKSPAAIVVALVLVAACRGPISAPPQPIPFDHSLHLQIELASGQLACVDCHRGAVRGTHAGLPALSTCLRCHMRPQGDPPGEREHLVRAAAASGRPFRWVQVTRNPGHVHFAHGPHVSLAGMVCADCHGDVTRWSRPPTVPDPDLTDMDECLACHRERGASTACETCHQ